MDLEVVAIKGLLIITLLAGGFGTANLARASAASEAAAPGTMTGTPAAAAIDAPERVYATYSNEALTAQAAQWDTLDVHQRRALLTEMRHRMAQRGSAAPGVIQIRTERRYGRLIRQPDGRVIRIETKVVQVRPATEAEVLASRSAGFGVGFERRTRSQLAAAGGLAVESDEGQGLVAPVSVPIPPAAESAKPSTAPTLQSLH